MHITLIHNPAAGSDRAVTKDVLIRSIERSGHTVAYKNIKDRDWKAALQWPAELIAVAGGDGAVAKVMRRMVGREIPVAILPLGTANNIACSLGLAGIKPERLIREWSSNVRIRVDMLWARGPWGERVIMESLGFGVMASVIAQKHGSSGVESRSRSARLRDARRRFRAALRIEKNHRIDGKLDGRDISGNYVLFEVMNIRYMGPNLDLAPKASLVSRQMHVLAVKKNSKMTSLPLNRFRTLSDKRHFKEWHGEALKLKTFSKTMHLDDLSFEAKSPSRTKIKVSMLKATLEILVNRTRSGTNGKKPVFEESPRKEPLNSA